MKSSIKKLPKSQIEIEVELPAEDLEKFIVEAKKHLAEHLDVPGFRKGNVPPQMVEEKIGKENILAEAADLAVNDAYIKIVNENKFEPISHPDAQIVKLAEGNPFIFKLTVSVLPEIELGDYQKIASQVKKAEYTVSEEEINNSLEYIKKSKAKFTVLDKPAETKDFVEIEYESPALGSMSALPENKDNKKVKDEFILGEGGFMPGFEKQIEGMKAGEEKEFNVKFPKNAQRKDLADKDVNFKVKMLAVKKVELPEVNDEFAKTLGKFDNVAALMASIKEGIAAEKEEQDKQKQRRDLLQKIGEKSKFELPLILVERETESLFSNFKDKINQNYKITFPEYLASVKQDEKTVKESFAKEAEVKVRNFLIIREIGKKEGIEVSDKELEEEVNHMIKHYPKEMVSKIDINDLREYTKGTIYNEKVFQKLESFVIKN